MQPIRYEFSIKIFTIAVCVLRVLFTRMFCGGPVRLGDIMTARLPASMSEVLSAAAMAERSSHNAHRHCV